MFHTNGLQEENKKISLLNELEINYKGREVQFCDNTENFILDINDIISNQKKLTIISGFAVKLSYLKRLELSLRDLLDATSSQIVIDAEHERLDLVILNQLKNNIIGFEDLTRLIVTVQVKRKDANEQVHNLTGFEQFGLKLLLVAGHKSYIEDYMISESRVSDRFLEFSEISNLFGYGIGNKMKQILENKGLAISTKNLLELQGYHQNSGSYVWTYYAGVNLTEDAVAYLERRGKDGDFLCRKMEDLINLGEDHDLILYIDACCAKHYLGKAIIIDQVTSANKMEKY